MELSQPVIYSPPSESGNTAYNPRSGNTARSGNWAMAKAMTQNKEDRAIKGSLLFQFLCKLFDDIDEPGNLTFSQVIMRLGRIAAWGLNHVIHIPQIFLAYSLYRINKSLNSEESQFKGKQQ